MSKYFIKEADRLDAAKKAAGLLTLEMRRRKFLKTALGAGVGVAGLAAFAGQCGGGESPTATTAPSAATAVPTAVATAAPLGTAAPMATAATGVVIIEPDVPVLEVRTSPPYGGSGVADRAIAGAKAITNKTTIGFAYASGSRPNWEPFIPEWKAATGIDVNLIEIPIGQIYEKMMQGAVTKESSWDVFVTNPRAMGDLLGAGAIVDWTEYTKK
ncbi:MAG: hypothetical protein M1358_16105, partial [Chloroflexi bacterium]|nr:hypothetical protein [Chloroflexota bacterium]